MRPEDYTKDMLEDIIASGDKREIINVITSSALHRDDYSYAIDLCNRFYSDPDVDIRACVLDALDLILLNFHKIDLDLALKILKHALKNNDREAEEAFSSVCHRISLKQRYIVKEELKEFYEQYNLHKYDYLFASKKLIKERLSKRQQRKVELKLCCEEMDKAIGEGLIEYEMTTREYCLISGKLAKEIKLCPWCGTTVKPSLVKKYFDLLHMECNIEIPDLTNYINIPDEFKTDEWWKSIGKYNFT